MFLFVCLRVYCRNVENRLQNIVILSFSTVIIAYFHLQHSRSRNKGPKIGVNEH